VFVIRPHLNQDDDDDDDNDDDDDDDDLIKSARSLQGICMHLSLSQFVKVTEKKLALLFYCASLWISRCFCVDV